MESKYFYGNEISDYGLENGYVDYRTLSKCFDAVLCNSIPEIHPEMWDYIKSGSLSYTDDYDDEIYYEIFQYYIVSDNALHILEEADEIVFYIPDLDVYVWGVTHYGTSWDYVLTNIKIDW